MHMRLLIPTSIAVVLLAGGCGSSKSASNTDTSSTVAATSSATTPSTTVSSQPSKPTGRPVAQLSSAQLIVKADGICKRLSIELSKDHFGSQQEVVRIAPRRAALEMTAVNELSNLTPPTSMAREYQRLLADRKQAAEDVKKIGEDAVVKNTQEEAAFYTAGAQLLREIAVIAQRNKFKHCGEVG